jgi:hypothetical protein
MLFRNHLLKTPFPTCEHFLQLVAC